MQDFEKYIPKFFNRDDKLQSFADAHDNQVESARADLINFKNISSPVKTPFVDELAEYLNADIIQSDTQRNKREKIYGAIAGHKNRSLWNDHAKPIVDSIAGGDAVIIRSLDSADWIMFGNESTDPDNYWAVMGTDIIDTSEYVFESETDFILVEAGDTSSNGTLGEDGIGEYGADMFGSQVGTIGDMQQGIDLIGAGDEIELMGNIYVDVDNSILSYKEVEQIRESLFDVVPAYFVVYLGYFNSNGQFVIYQNGIIGKDINNTFLTTAEGKQLTTADGKRIILYTEVE